MLRFPEIYGIRFRSQRKAILVHADLLRSPTGRFLIPIKESGTMPVKSKTEEEVGQIIEEVKKRSLEDFGFRALALSDPLAAIAKLNLPAHHAHAIRFVESDGVSQSGTQPGVTIVVLPPSLPVEEELSDADLEKVAGGSSTPPVGLS